MEEQYFLAIEVKPHDYFPINIQDLKIGTNFHYNKLAQLDQFTLKYTQKEIKEAIKEANLLTIEDYMPLIIIYYEKNNVRKMAVLTKDISFDMWNEIKENYNNKNFLTKINNFLNNIVDITALKKALTYEEYLNELNKFPYLVLRKLYFYLYEK